MSPLLLDLCCCQGGASKGYADLGFTIVGIDKDPQPRYPYEFHQGDALQFLRDNGKEFDAIHASFPCQAFTKAWKIRKNEHPDLVTPGRQLLLEIGKPWVMENVPGAPLINPVELCGCMFPSLGVYRERWFEVSDDVVLRQPTHRPHDDKITKMGRPPKEGERMHIVGNFSGVPKGRQAMGIDWMSRDGLREAIPPAYTRHVGRELMSAVMRRAS